MVECRRCDDRDCGVIDARLPSLIPVHREPRASRPLHPDSLVVAAGRPGGPGEPVNQPLTLASTYRAGGERVYAREGNPTWGAFEDALGALEGGSAIAFGSGMAAAAALLESLPAGARVVVSKVAYHGVVELVDDRVAAGRLGAAFVDARDRDAVASACREAALLWLESPTNPLLDVVDLAALAELAHSHGALVVVDNTFATPLRQLPLDLGADVVVHSATKFLGGHSDLLLGAVVTADNALAERLLRRRLIDGSVPGSMEAFLALRGLRTLAVRLDRAERTAAELAARLGEHPAVTRVRYPGLADDPGHDLAARQMSGFGAVLAFETAGDAAGADRICEAVELITHATSLGGVETLLERRARYSGDERAGTPPTLIRLSVGLEDPDDLWADIERALDAAR
jgi:cystathionine gamma-synthase